VDAELTKEKGGHKQEDQKTNHSPILHSLPLRGYYTVKLGDGGGLRRITSPVDHSELRGIRVYGYTGGYMEVFSRRRRGE
jgi:hypothetical protein